MRVPSESDTPPNRTPGSARGLVGNGGGVVLEPYYEWISETTGVVIPEPAYAVRVGGIAVLLVIFWRRSGKTS